MRSYSTLPSGRLASCIGPTFSIFNRKAFSPIDIVRLVYEDLSVSVRRHPYRPDSIVTVTSAKITLERTLCSLGSEKGKVAPADKSITSQMDFGDFVASFSTVHFTAAVLYVESWVTPQVQLHLSPGHLANLGVAMLEVGLRSLCE